MARKVLFGKPSTARGGYAGMKNKAKKSLASGVSRSGTANSGTSLSNGKNTSPISVRRSGPTFNRNIYNKKQVTYGK